MIVVADRPLHCSCRRCSRRHRGFVVLVHAVVTVDVVVASCIFGIPVLDDVVIVAVVIVAIIDVIGIVNAVDIMIAMVVADIIGIDIFAVVDVLVSVPIIGDRHYSRRVCWRRIFANLRSKRNLHLSLNTVTVYRLTEVFCCSSFDTVYRHCTGL